MHQEQISQVLNQRLCANYQHAANEHEKLSKSDLWLQKGSCPVLPLTLECPTGVYYLGFTSYVGWTT